MKQYKIVIKASETKLKQNSTNFIVWLEEQTNHINTMGIESICKLGLPNATTLHPIHDLFTTASTLFESYGLVTLEQVIQVSDKIYNGTSAEELIEIEKDKWFFKI